MTGAEDSVNFSFSREKGLQKFLCFQVCGVFLLFISGAHTLMYWGLYCYPWLRNSFIAAYYLAAAGCVLGGLRAKTQVRHVRYEVAGDTIFLTFDAQAIYAYT